MPLKKIVNKIKKEAEVLQGKATKEKTYRQEHTYPDEQTAKQEFENAKLKLFNINLWSHLEGIDSTFVLYDERGRRTNAEMPKVGYYIKIVLPVSKIENWVKVTDITTKEKMAEFVVHPSEKPAERTDEEKVIEHFFIKEASSTFRVERQGKTLIGYEIGKNEGINNRGEEAGDRALINTLIAEGGWAGVQELQWDKLIYFFVCPKEAKWLDSI